ncbi:peptidoglycan glycosyltransferase [Arachidicoccus ginsenosidimutans]|uniref:penicillin-binding protein 1A n=1 Tax=Arachidicoccus sp. BS20 TaxID=1850526 RepID=UPI0007F14177|nr:transglycosylase domain-containing protein [Arachidicoccus sp. BS20]ANI88798.1 peptidoglycan glycosyltransferase [Arachidicoccus sp. BS20]
MNTTSTQEKRPKNIAVRILWMIFFAGIIGVVLLLLMANYGLLGEMPSIEQLQNPSASEASQIYADDGSLMGKVFQQDRVNVSFNDISPNVVHALVATEDERFYSHNGVDPHALARAFFSLGGEGGASTITMQTAKNLFTNYKRNTLIRIFQKIKEAIIAVKLERNFTKNEILTLYLNTVPFGDNVYGIRNAARTFFQTDPSQLSVAQAAVLIGMLKASTAYNPRIHPDRALARRNVVIGQMVRNGFVSQSEAQQIKATPIVLNYHKLNEANGLAPYFRMILVEQLKNWCKNNPKPDGTPYDLYTDGLKIYTTINPHLQKYAEEAVAKHMSYMQQILNAQSDIKNGSVWKAHQRTLDWAMRHSIRWNNEKNDGLSDNEIVKTFNVKTKMTVFAYNYYRHKDTVMTPLDSIKYMRQMLQAGFMAMDPLSGEVKAWVGGIDYRHFKYDHVNINTKRQVGSTIKPLLYSLAIEKGGFTPNTPVQDERQYFNGYGYVPATGASCTGRTMPMSEALAESRNCATAYIEKQLGPNSNEGAVKFVDFLQQCGISSKLEPYPSIVLGSEEISLYEMMQAFSMFPGRGFNVQPMLITRIEDAHGNVLFTSTPKRKQIISDITASSMVSMMQDVINYGTGRRLNNYDVQGDIAGKTGTTNDNSDAWFIGYTPQLLVGIWTGCDDRFIHIQSESEGQGAAVALPIWAYFFNKAENDPSTGLNVHQKFDNNFNSDSGGQSLIYDWANNIPDSTDSIQNKLLPNNIKPQDIGPESDSGDNINDNQAPVGGDNSSLPAKKPQTKPKAVMPAPSQKQPEKKKEGLLKRIFGGKNKNKQ